MFDSEKLKSVLIKPAFIGGTAFALSMVMDSNLPNVNAFGINLSAPLAFGLVAGGASELAELGRQYIFPEIPYINRYAKMESMILEPLLAIISFLGIMYVADRRYVSGNMTGLSLLALGSVTGGNYLYDTFIAK